MPKFGSIEPHTKMPAAPALHLKMVRRGYLCSNVIFSLPSVSGPRQMVRVARWRST
jgi:hypothetical protein